MFFWVIVHEQRHMKCRISAGRKKANISQTTIKYMKEYGTNGHPPEVETARRLGRSSRHPALSERNSHLYLLNPLAAGQAPLYSRCLDSLH